MAHILKNFVSPGWTDRSTPSLTTVADSLVTQQPWGGYGALTGGAAARRRDEKVLALEAYWRCLHPGRNCSPSNPTTCRGRTRHSTPIVQWASNSPVRRHAPESVQSVLFTRQLAKSLVSSIAVYTDWEGTEVDLHCRTSIPGGASDPPTVPTM